MGKDINFKILIFFFIIYWNRRSLNIFGVQLGRMIVINVLVLCQMRIQCTCWLKWFLRISSSIGWMSLIFHFVEHGRSILSKSQVSQLLLGLLLILDLTRGTPSSKLVWRGPMEMQEMQELPIGSTNKW